MTHRIEGGVSYTQTFDFENRLTSVQTITGTTTFVYDGDGQRVLQTRPDTSWVAYVGALMEVETNYTYYLPRPTGSSVASGAIAANGSRGSVTAFVGGAARLEFTQGTTAVLGGGGTGQSRLTSTTTRLYYLVNGHAVALRQVANDGTNTVYYMQPDALGSTTLTLDDHGAVAGQLRYTAYGAPLSSSGTTPTSRRYTGQIADDTTGLVYFQARYYDATLARWTQPDTIAPSANNPQDLNRYGYGRNNPLKYSDPSGHTVAPISPTDITGLGSVGITVVRIGCFIAGCNVSQSAEGKWYVGPNMNNLPMPAMVSAAPLESALSSGAAQNAEEEVARFLSQYEDPGFKGNLTGATIPEAENIASSAGWQSEPALQGPDPKLTSPDGLQELRPHSASNLKAPVGSNAASGPTIRVGIQLPDDLQAKLPDVFGSGVGDGGWVDPQGWSYFDDEGTLTEWRSNAGHIPLAGNANLGSR